MHAQHIIGTLTTDAPNQRPDQHEQITETLLTGLNNADLSSYLKGWDPDTGTLTFDAIHMDGETAAVPYDVFRDRVYNLYYHDGIAELRLNGKLRYMTTGYTPEIHEIRLQSGLVFHKRLTVAANWW